MVSVEYLLLAHSPVSLQARMIVLSGEGVTYEILLVQVMTSVTNGRYSVTACASDGQTCRRCLHLRERYLDIGVAA